MQKHSVTLDKARTNRKAASPAEKALWQLLRAGRTEGLKFRRQHVLGEMILDFYCHAARVAVELDGPSHDSRLDQDRLRDVAIEARGVLVVRVFNHDVLRSAKAFADYIGSICLDRIAGGK